PFSRYTGHDKWILACASSEGSVGYIEDTLVQYRRHGHNVSGVLSGINSKQDYINNRVVNTLNIVKDFEKKYPNHKDLKEIYDFCHARMNGNVLKLIKYRYIAPDVTKFDIVISLVPSFLFVPMMKMARKISTK
ncbi:MAG: glycosyl transferase, partial [Holdemanella sp.]|nr:glycosyl transferase [Holdemanella sp.]